MDKHFGRRFLTLGSGRLARLIPPVSESRKPLAQPRGDIQTLGGASSISDANTRASTFNRGLQTLPVHFRCWSVNMTRQELAGMQKPGEKSLEHRGDEV